MRNLLFTVAFLVASNFTVQAQELHCGFDEHLDKMLAEDPSGLQTILEHQARAREITQQRLSNGVEKAGGPRIIPTVFHVIHQGGNENISYEQIEDQMRILNEDYRRLNADASDTRAEFVGVAADANVEFRLAQLDPQGNCTDGVVRVWSALTFNASDESGVKGLSYWNSNKYFNVWVVATIDGDGGQGTTLGYAQFPGFGNATTDGVVVRADFIGSIGTAANTGYKGRVLTHEAGHWFGLFHTFQGGCNGTWPFGEGVDDTPPEEAASGSCSFGLNTCNNDNPDLPDQIENYMDYTPGQCQNMLTLGQKDVIDAVLDGSRSQIHSTGNLNDTGVLLSTTPCQPYAHFYAEETIVCTGQNVSFIDDSYNGQVTTYNWQFTGATPSTSASANPTVTYDTPGLYSVSLSVENAQGSDSHAITDYIRVIPGSAEVTSYFSFEGFEETNEDYLILSDGLGNTWEETGTAYTGSSAIKINNFSGNPVDSEDEFLLPSVDLTQMNDPKIYFKVAHRQRSGGESDNLRIYVSRDCGEQWSLRFNASSTTLSSVSGTTGSSFTPSGPSQWKEEDVNLSSFANDEHVLVKFRGTSDAGNNIYLDDIQISGPLSITDRELNLDLGLSPNPTDGASTLTMHVRNQGDYQVYATDVTGKRVAQLFAGTLNYGQQSVEINRGMLNPGIYLIHVEGMGGRGVKKLVVQ